MVQQLIPKIIIFVLLSNIALAQVQDNNLVETYLKEKINNFNEYSERKIMLAVEETTENSQEKAIQIFNQNTADILILYIKNSKDLVIVQPEDKIIADEQVKAILDKNRERKNLAETKQDINLVLNYIVEEIIDIIKPLPKKSTFCGVIKDGYCDYNCPITDLDCLCGNNICESFETKQTCPEDCEKPKEYICGIVRDGNCEQTCGVTDIDCRMEKMSNITMNFAKNNKINTEQFELILFLILIILGSICLYLIYKDWKIQW